MKFVYTMLVIIALAVVGIFSLLAGQQANAGVGTTAFAPAARQGINSALIKAYGSLKNSPYSVTCSQKPSGINQQPGNFTVTCKVVFHQ